MRRLLGLALCSLLFSGGGAEAQSSSGSFTSKVTSYCLSGTTRLGTPVRPGVVAVDPGWIPLGATVQIEGLDGLFSAEDTGGGIHGPHIEFWQGSCEEAFNWGVRYRDVTWWQ